MNQSMLRSIEGVIASMSDFEPCAWIEPEMDQLIYIEEDVSYTADRVDPVLTLLWHPDVKDQLVGIKFKGIRHLFEELKSSGVVDEDGQFIDLVKAFSFILVESLGSEIMTELAGQHREIRREKYRRARELSSRAGKVPLRLTA